MIPGTSVFFSITFSKPLPIETIKNVCGKIPINASNAEDKMTNKGDDHDIDQLFLNALNLRWLFIDEFPTNAPGVLGILDAFLRRACCRHLYAKSKQGVQT